MSVSSVFSLVTDLGIIRKLFAYKSPWALCKRFNYHKDWRVDLDQAAQKQLEPQDCPASHRIVLSPGS